MTDKAKQLQEALYQKTEHSFNVEYDNKQGWLFWSDEFYVQRLGYNYRQAEKFIAEFDWTFIKEHQAEESCNRLH